MLNIEVLLSCMNESRIEEFCKVRGIKSDAVIVNQCGNDYYDEFIVNGNKIKTISSSSIGLSKSRNIALENATGDICILCDDDVEYVENYVEVITGAFQEISDADVIVFNINRINLHEPTDSIHKIRIAPKYKAYGSVRIAFKRNSIRESKLGFDENFGAGSIYSSGEDSIFLWELRKRGLKVYEYPATIATVDFSDSSWFRGYNEKFFYDKGAMLAAAFPKSKYILVLYFLLRLKKHVKLSSSIILSSLLKGVKSYNLLKPYND